MLAELALAHFFRPRRPEMQGLRQDAGFHLQVAPGHDVVENAHALEQRQVLEGAGDAVLRGVVGVHVVPHLAPKDDLAFLRVVHAVDAVEHRAFSRAVRADDGAHLVLADVERDVLQRLDAAEGKGDVLDVENDVTDVALSHQAAFLATGKVFASTIWSVALTWPTRPSSNLTWVSMNCSARPP